MSEARPALEGVGDGEVAGAVEGVDAERAVVLSESQQVDVAHLPLYLQESGGIQVTTKEGFTQAKERVIAMFEREAVGRFLEEARGNISVAAQRAGITRRNFHRLLSKYSINRKNYRKES